MSRTPVLQMSCFAVALAVLTSVAGAAPITFEFEGEVTDVPVEVSAQFSVGESVVGRYTFESTRADSDLSDEYGRYLYLISLEAIFGGDYTLTASGPGTDITVANRTNNTDIYNVFVGTPSGPELVPNIVPFIFTLNLHDSTMTAFSSDALPLVPPDLAGFDLDHSGLHYQGAAGGVVSFQVTSLQLATPEPGAGVLALLGAIAVAVPVWRRR